MACGAIYESPRSTHVLASRWRLLALWAAIQCFQRPARRKLSLNQIRSLVICPSTQCSSLSEHVQAPALTRRTDRKYLCSSNTPLLDATQGKRQRSGPLLDERIWPPTRRPIPSARQIGPAGKSSMARRWCDAAHELNVPFERQYRTCRMRGDPHVEQQSDSPCATAFGTMIVAVALVRSGDRPDRPPRAPPAPARSSPTRRCRPKRSSNAAQTLTVRAAPGARYQPLYKKGDPLPVGNPAQRGRAADRVSAELFRRKLSNPDAARHCSGPRHEMGVDVTKARTSMLVLDGTVGVTNRRLNQLWSSPKGRASISLRPTRPRSENAGERARVRALLSRFGE